MGSIFSDKRYTEEAMKMAAKVSKQVESRHAKWMVSLRFLVDQSSVDHVFSRQTEFCDTIILNEKERVTGNQRLLLECERKRVLDKRIKSLVKQQQHKQNVDLITDTARQVMEERFKKVPIERLTGIHDGFAHFSSFAYTPSLNFQKLGSMTIMHHSLSKDIMDLVNNQKFCEQMGKGRRNITDAKTAIGFIGIENCRMLFPILMAKPLLKWADNNTKLITPKLWQHAIITANVARMRLKASGYKEPDEGVYIGVLRSLALFSICNHFSNCFDEAKEMVMQDFRQRELRDEYFSCVDITPKLGFLPGIIQNWEKKVTRRIVDYIDWGPRNLHLKNALLEDIEDIPVLERSVHGVALGQARAFSIYDMMDRSQGFEPKHTPFWLANMQLDGKTFDNIRRQDPGKFAFSR